MLEELYFLPSASTSTRTGFMFFTIASTVHSRVLNKILIFIMLKLLSPAKWALKLASNK
jgi:hypothetical protein